MKLALVKDKKFKYKILNSTFVVKKRKLLNTICFSLKFAWCLLKLQYNLSQMFSFKNSSICYNSHTDRSLRYT